MAIADSIVSGGLPGKSMGTLKSHDAMLLSMDTGIQKSCFMGLEAESERRESRGYIAMLQEPWEDTQVTSQNHIFNVHYADFLWLKEAWESTIHRTVRRVDVILRLSAGWFYIEIHSGINVDADVELSASFSGFVDEKSP